MTSTIRRASVIGLGVLFGTLGPIGAVADTPSPGPASSSTKPAAAPADNSLSMLISPTRLVVGQADIGTTQQLTVLNRGKTRLQVDVTKRNFSAGRDGSLSYDDNAPYAASNWVTLSTSKLDLAPGASEIVQAKVTAPKNFEPGDHQVAVVFMVAAGKTAGNIKINRGIATPVYVTAPGPITDSVALSALSAPKFVSIGNVPITATILNNGTVHHDFRSPSPLTVQGAGKAEPFPDFTVPRDSVRDIATSWNPPFMCICHPSVTLTSANGGVQTQSVRVIVFPWQWIGAGVGTLLLVLLLVKLARRTFRAQVLKAAALQQPVGRNDV